jgi:hypothetical protein
MVAGRQGPAPPPGPLPPPGVCVPLDDTIPAGAPYDSIPAETMVILQRSYRERDGKNMNLVDAFDNKKPDESCPQSKVTFRQALDRLMATKPFYVLEEMRSRCASTVPGLWKKIKWLHQVYDWDTSRGIWVCMYPDQVLPLRVQLRASLSFCADMFVGHSTHQKGNEYMKTTTPSQCYRELGKLGQAGLHICFMVTSVKNSEFGEWHNIHVDPHQIAGARTLQCSCWYAQTSYHFRDVGPWCVRWFLSNYGKRPDVKTALVLLGVNPDNPDRAYEKLMEITGDYDTFVDMADHPEKYDKWDVKVKAKIKLAQMYKGVYMGFMPPQYNP